MAQFDLYPNPNPDTRHVVPYLLDIQHDLHAAGSRRLVVPLARGQTPITRLNPVVEIQDETLTLMTEQMASIPASLCRHPIANLRARRSEIIDAVDFLIQGF
jgi:toxin CcdB